MAYDCTETPAIGEKSSDLTTTLASDGYVIARDLIDSATIGALHNDLRTAFDLATFSVGDFYGSRTKRFGSALKRSRLAEALVLDPVISEVVQSVLGPWCDNVQLNLTQAIEIHPGELIQAPHRDQDMWRVSPGKIECLINVMWPLTPFTAENGATLVWPGSHQNPKDYVPDFAKAVPAAMDPGSALIWLGSTLHGGGANRTDRPRAGLIVSYCLGWLRTFENQFLAYPPEVASAFPPELARLVGYQQHRPSLGNHEGRCPSELLRGRSEEVLPFQDELPAWQAGAVTSFKRHFAPHIRVGA